MTIGSDQLLEALSACVAAHFPRETASGFAVRLPIGGYPARAQYVDFSTKKHLGSASAHEQIQHALFLSQVEGLFATGGAGAAFMEEADILTQQATGFVFHSVADLRAKTFETKNISPDALQPTLTFRIAKKANRIETCSFVDGVLHQGMRSPVLSQFPVLKKQEELRRFLHLLAYFKGPVSLWRVYFFRTTVTIRAPSRAAACFLVQALMRAKKSMKSDCYDVASCYRVHCTLVEPEHVIQAYQEDMKALRLL